MQDGLQDHEFFKNVRGRGLRNSVEISCENEHLFGLAVTERMKNEHGILINGKWHRFTFSNAMIISDQEIQWSLDKFLTLILFSY